MKTIAIIHGIAPGLWKKHANMSLRLDLYFGVNTVKAEGKPEADGPMKEILEEAFSQHLRLIPCLTDLCKHLPDQKDGRMT